MPPFHNELKPPVKIIAKGAGVVVFDDSARLFEWLSGLPERKEVLLSIQQGGRAITPENVGALETLVWLQGFDVVERAGKRAGAPYNRFPTKWSWDHLAEYLGWTWRPIA